MGYDVYLSWDGMTDDERDAQKTGWSLVAGHVGYLRAANWMQAEVHLLGSIIPGEYWLQDRRDNFDPLPYNFETNFPRMRKAAQLYLKNAGAKHDFEYLFALPSRGPAVETEEPEAKEDWTEYPTDYLQGDDAEEWIHSVIDFFKLGLKLQREGKNPKVEVA